MSNPKSLNVIFMGTPDFAVPSLEAIHNSSHHIQLVVTVPDKPYGRGQKLRASAVKQKAEELDLPIAQPLKLLEAGFTQQIHDLAPDVIVVVAFRILPEAIFSIPRLGTFNLHASLLPRYRGAAPIHWALLNGDHTTGVTTFFLKKTVDTGNIIQQRSLDINPDDNLSSLYISLCALGADTVVETLDMIASEEVKTVSQNDALASPAPKVGPEDQQINFTEPAALCHNRVRAFAPRPGAYCERAGQRIKLLRSLVVEMSGRPGEIVAISKDHFTIACGKDALCVYELQPANKKPMDAGAYLRGYPLQIGDTLG